MVFKQTKTKEDVLAEHVHEPDVECPTCKHSMKRSAKKLKCEGPNCKEEYDMIKPGAYVKAKLKECPHCHENVIVADGYRGGDDCPLCHKEL